MLTLFPFRSRFELSAVLAIITAIPLAVVYPQLVILPIAIFVLLCLTGPFVQRLSFFLPIIRRGVDSRAEIAITFDDGPDPETTPLLLDLLSRFNAKATFFVIGKKVSANADLIQKILADGHDIGNHSDSHDVFLMLRGQRRIEKEIRKCQERLVGFSIRPRLFRPPVGITNPHLRLILSDLNLTCVGFSCRPRDFGNRYIDNIRDRVLKKIRAGDILLLHDCVPHGEATPDQWLEQVEGILVGLQEKQLKIVPLSQLLGQPIMDNIGDNR